MEIFKKTFSCINLRALLIDPLRLDFVCKFNKSLYGLKQGPRAWFEKLHNALVSFGFASTKFDQFLFVNITPYCSTYVLVHVNDILLIESSELFIQQVVT